MAQNANINATGNTNPNRGLNPAPAGTVNTNAGGNTGTEGNAGAGGSANGSAGAGTGGGAGPVFRDDAMLNCGQVVELITKSFQLAAVVKDMKGKGKRPREAEQGGGNTNKRLDGGRHQRGGGGHNRNGGVASGVHIPNDEFEARKRAGVCTFCGRDGHFSNKCCNSRSIVPSFGGRN
ncbi:TPA: hypothetical protein ACH3X2_004044 [Trebouxia sp. C0005]